MSARTFALTLAAMLAFASNSLLCRGALGAAEADATSFTSLRLASGALVLALLARGRAAGDAGGGWASAFALFVYAIGFSLAYLRIAAGVGALLLFGAVQATMLGGGLLRGERPGGREWIGLALALAGLVILTRPGLTAPDPLGAALMIGAGVAWGVYSLRGWGARPLPANASNFARSVPLALLASLLALALAPPRLTPAGAVLALISGGLASGVGYAVWYAALRGLSAAQAGIVQLSVPPLAAAGGALLLGETVTARLVASGGLVLGGIALATSRRG